ncbi:hypothetical protein BDV06DRAFT_191307 [Aspergillus oleicola]
MGSIIANHIRTHVGATDCHPDCAMGTCKRSLLYAMCWGGHATTRSCIGTRMRDPDSQPDYKGSALRCAGTSTTSRNEQHKNSKSNIVRRHSPTPI